MNLQIARVHLRSAGHPDARAEDVTLDLRGTTGSPEHSLLWLRNAGGKTTLVRLLFALLQPDASARIGSEETGRRQGGLVEYVRADDTTHVVIEWRHAQDRLLDDGWRLLTGFAAEWRGTPTRSVSDLARIWYTVEGTSEDLLIERLPFVTEINGERRRLRLNAYREQLTAMFKNESVVHTVQLDWVQHLDDLGIDRMLVRYMSRMNRNEAGASAIATWRDETEFVRSFVETAVEPGRLQRIDQEIEAVMAKVRRLPDYEAQLRFERALHEVLRPLGLRVHEAEVAEREDRSASSEAALLRGGLAARAAAEEEHAADAKRRRDEQQRAYDQHQAEDNRWTDIAREHERDAAAFAHKDAETTLASAEREKVSRAADITAWQVTEDVLRDSRLRELLAAAEAVARTEREHFRPLEDDRDAAALDLASAYDAAIQEADARAGSAADEANRERVRADDEQQQANAARIEAATLLARITSKEERLEEAREQRRRAVKQQYLGAEEPTEAAIARTQTDAAAALKERDVVNTEIGVLAAERGTIAAAAAADTEERAHHERAIGEVSPKLQSAARERQQIGTDVLAREVAQLGEGATLDLNIVGHDLVARLVERQHADERRERELDLGAALERHALETIERDRLLPPTTIVEQALVALSNAGVRGALAGTRYAAEAMNEADRVRAVETDPELLAGIVFTDPQILGQAEQVLTSARLPLSAPLVVGIAEDLHAHEGRVRRGFVLPPLDASWDRDAAEVEAERLTAALRATDEQRRDLQLRALDAQRLASRMTAYLDEYGNGTLTSLEARLEHAQASIERIERGEAERSRRLDSIAAREHDLRLRLQDLVDTRMRCENALVALAELSATEARTAAFGQEIDHLRGEAEGFRELAERASGAADAARVRAERALDEARNLRAVAAEQRNALAALPATAREAAKRGPRPTTGDVPTLRSRYEALDRQLQERMDASEALRAVTRYQQETAESEATLARHDRMESGVVARARGLLALPQASTSQGREEALRAARQELQRAEAAWAAATSLRDAALEKLNELEEQIRSSRRPRRLADGERALDLTSATLRAADAKRHSEQEKAQQAAAEQARNAAETERRDAESAGERISSLVEQLGALDVHAPLQDHVAIAGTTAELAQQTQAVVERLRTARASHQGAQAARADADADLLRVLGRGEFAALGPTNRLHGMLSSMAPTERAARVGDLVIEVSTLIDSVERELASAEKDLDLATTVVSEAVDDTLSLLHTAQRSSKMPSTLRGWAGEPFLLIKFRKGTPEETKAALRPFVKGLVQQRVPTAEELIVQAIGRAVGKVTVEILKPNEGFELRRVPITELASFSGGQRATSAIALMLMFSELRHRSRAATRAASIGTLVLDNPLGNANAGFLLDVQLAVARAAGIQLVYLTGISDEAALRRFPNIVALSNDAAKRTNWHYIRVNDALRKLLTPDDLSDGGKLTAAHVALPAVETTTA